MLILSLLINCPDSATLLTLDSLLSIHQLLLNELNALPFSDSQSTWADVIGYCADHEKKTPKTVDFNLTTGHSLVDVKQRWAMAGVSIFWSGS